ncbi:hypothetical protein [Actinomadura sp. GTD37]|uniref:hypothetical protein n=1 Tax=Actinomadura sp. GTD37 TaxID=1778030 RepID=UPI0035C0917F
MARRHLTPGYDRPPYDIRLWGSALTLQDLLDVLSNAGAEADSGFVAELAGIQADPLAPLTQPGMVAATNGCRVLWLVAAAPMPICSVAVRPAGA